MLLSIGYIPSRAESKLLVKLSLLTGGGCLF